MKSWPFLLAGMLAMSLVGCSSAPKRVSADILQRQWQQRNMQSVGVCHFLGEADGKVYVLLKTFSLFGSENKESVIAAPVKDLNPDLLNELRASTSKSRQVRKTSEVPKFSDLHQIRPF